jgi:hypothetical protein
MGGSLHFAIRQGGHFHRLCTPTEASVVVSGASRVAKGSSNASCATAGAVAGGTTSEAFVLARLSQTD